MKTTANEQQKNFDAKIFNEPCKILEKTDTIVATGHTETTYRFPCFKFQLNNRDYRLWQCDH